jgi:hypothetical protein
MGVARRTQESRPAVTFAEQVYQIADELRATANLGLHYAENQYDKERYGRVLSASARLVAALEQRPPDEVLAQFEDNLRHVSPMREQRPRFFVMAGSSSSGVRIAACGRCRVALWRLARRWPKRPSASFGRRPT